MTTSRRCTGAILAGGGATRFGGRPKGLEVVDGRRVLDRAADALRPASDALLLVANATDAASWLPGVPVRPDVRPGLGSLGGLHAALAHAGGTDVLVLPWDMPFVPPGLMAALRATGESLDVDAVLAEGDGPGGIEPLCAWYAAPALAAVARLLDRGERRVRELAQELRVARLPRAEVARHGDPAMMFLNVNTPAELARARALAGGADGALS